MMRRCEGVCVEGNACPGEMVCNLVVVSMQVFQGTCMRVQKCLGLGSCVALGWVCDCAAAGVTKHVTAWLRSLDFPPVLYLFLLIADMSSWDRASGYIPCVSFSFCLYVIVHFCVTGVCVSGQCGVCGQHVVLCGMV